MNKSIFYSNFNRVAEIWGFDKKEVEDMRKVVNAFQIQDEEFERWCLFQKCRIIPPNMEEMYLDLKEMKNGRDKKTTD